jgi:hypothetical protein
MPLADETGRVAGLLEELGDGDFAELQAFAMLGMVACRMNHGLNARPLLIPPRQQRRPRGGTERAIGMKVHQPHPLRRQPINPRRLEVGIAEATGPGIAHVIDEDDDDIGAVDARSR